MDRNQPAQPRLKPGRASAEALIAIVGFILVCGGVILGVYYVLQRNGPGERPLETTPTGARAHGPATGSAPVSEPAEAEPAEARDRVVAGLFAVDVLTAKGEMNKALWSLDMLIEQAPRQAWPEDPEVRRTELIAGARRFHGQALEEAIEKAGDPVTAERAVVALLHGWDKQLWPEGAEASLRDLRARLREAGQGSAELARQREHAAGLYERALAAEKAGRLGLAQELLLKVLNEHPEVAWPKGAGERLSAVQNKITTPASLPTFFDD
jgi:hypothetical protein